MAASTIASAFELWCGSESRPRSTVSRYTFALRRLAELGLSRLSDVTVERVDAVQRDLLAEGWRVSAVRTELAALRSVLAFLVVRKKFPRERLADLREIAVPFAKHTGGRRIRFLTREEVERLTAAARVVAPRIELPVLVGVLAGPRTGELARLRAEDVDFERRTIRVETLPEFGEAGATKTGPRTVPMCSELAEILKDRAPRTGWLFPSAYTGGRRGPKPKTPFLSRWTFETDFVRARVAARLGSDVTPTTLRHTRASWWIQGGMSLVKAAKFLGHDAGTCARYYAALTEGYDPDCERAPR